MDIGLRVVRGPHWKWQNQDGGEGHAGTVVEVVGTVNSNETKKTVVVQWDCGSRTSCRMGYQNECELLVWDRSPTGLKHELITCDSCNQREIFGTRWYCRKCCNYDLCHSCYMTGKDDLSHYFYRYDDIQGENVRPRPVSERSNARRLEVKGIFPGAIVVRGPDWNWGNQDGGPGNRGIVLKIQDFQNESGQSMAVVQWGSGSTHEYRLGHQGKVDLKYVAAASGGFYYPEHLLPHGLKRKEYTDATFRAILQKKELMASTKGSMKLLAVRDFDPKVMSLREEEELLIIFKRFAMTEQEERVLKNADNLNSPDTSSLPKQDKHWKSNWESKGELEGELDMELKGEKVNVSHRKHDISDFKDEGEDGAMTMEGLHDLGIDEYMHGFSSQSILDKQIIREDELKLKTFAIDVDSKQDKTSDLQDEDLHGTVKMEEPTTSDEEVETDESYFSKEKDEFYAISLALAFERRDTMETFSSENISYMDGWWIARNLNNGKIGFIPRNRVVIENDHEHTGGSTELKDLPIELLDLVLEKTCLHWTLNSSDRRSNRYVIKTLASIKFCWFEITTRRRFKKRIWQRFKDFFGKTRKGSAIIRNNRNYLLANIKSDATLIDSLVFFNIITDVQRRIFQHRNSALLGVMSSFDVTTFSNFVKCLRKANQKTVARIIENGGGVMKVDVRNNQGANCTKSKESLLHKNIEDRRNRIKPCSLQSYKLISQLNDEGIEILNSHLDRQTVVVWIWCRSQAALNHIKKLYEGNQLREVLYGIANIPTSTNEIAQSNVIINEENQLKKTVVVCPISVNFTKRIDLRTYNYVRGITKLRNEIYIMGRASDRSPIEISVFEDRIPFGLKKKLKTNQFSNAEEIESCEKENCLYVRYGAGKCVWKISIKTEKQHKTIKWLTLDYVPWRMSVTSDAELLIVNQSSSTLMIYGSDAELLHSIQLPTDISNPGHVVKTSIGNFIIINEGEEGVQEVEKGDEEEEEEEKEKEKEEKEEKGDQEKGEEHDETWVKEKGERGTMGENTPKVEMEKQEDKERRKGKRVDVKESGPRKIKRGKKTSYLVRELTGDRQTVIRRFVPSNATHQLNYPQCLSIDSDDQVFVADMGNDRVILLDSDLKWKSILCPTKEEESKIYQPTRLCYDEKNKQLIVGGSNGANVYTLSQY